MDATTAGYADRRLLDFYAHRARAGPRPARRRGGGVLALGSARGRLDARRHPRPRGAAPGQDDVGVHVHFVSPGFFATMGIPMLAGRDVSATDRRGRRRPWWWSNQARRAESPPRPDGRRSWAGPCSTSGPDAGRDRRRRRRRALRQPPRTGAADHLPAVPAAPPAPDVVRRPRRRRADRPSPRRSAARSRRSMRTCRCSASAPRSNSSTSRSARSASSPCWRRASACSRSCSPASGSTARSATPWPGAGPRSACAWRSARRRGDVVSLIVCASRWRRWRPARRSASGWRWSTTRFVQSQLFAIAPRDPATLAAATAALVAAALRRRLAAVAAGGPASIR